MKLSLFSSVTVLVLGYVSFLFVSYAIYGFIYGRLATYRGAEFVVVDRAKPQAAYWYPGR